MNDYGRQNFGPHDFSPGVTLYKYLMFHGKWNLQVSLKFWVIQMGPEEKGREGETEKD